MTRSYRYLHYDVFTDHLFGGNQLAVFLDARGLNSETMQAIAKEMNFSETTFILPSEKIGTDLRMRIFTPADELPMAGHPTVGSTRDGARRHHRAWPRHFTFGLNIGPTPVTLTWQDGQLTFVWMTRRCRPSGEPIRIRLGRAALSLSPVEVAGTGWLVRGFMWRSVPIRSVDDADGG
jgi:trans-2,3-dihydro-3-hydroxyanthranilate isomerase